MRKRQVDAGSFTSNTDVPRGLGPSRLQMLGKARSELAHHGSTALPKDDAVLVRDEERLARDERVGGHHGVQLLRAHHLDAQLARELRVSEPTVRDWISILKSLYYGFEVRPWFRNVENSLRKTPKWYLRDWSGIDDEGKRGETMIACHLLKAVELWTDLGLGDYALYYLRTKQRQEVDFLVVRDGSPWFLVEAKTGDTHISPVLGAMQKALNAPHAFQVVMDLPFVEADAFARTDPVVVPARTFLSQLP